MVTTGKETGMRKRRNGGRRSKTKHLRRGRGRRTSCSAPGERRQVLYAAGVRGATLYPKVSCWRHRYLHATG